MDVILLLLLVLMFALGAGVEWAMTQPTDTPDEYPDLAEYDSRVARGVVHTPEYVARMERARARRDLWRRATRP